MSKADKKMELEESINNLKRLVELRKNKCGEIKFDTCICNTKDLEIVLQELKNLKEECRQYREFIIATGGKDIDDITATQYVKIQQEGYLRGRKEEQEKAKQFIEENSIPKKKIEDKIKELEHLIKGTKDVIGLSVARIKYEGAINVLQELLEVK